MEYRTIEVAEILGLSPAQVRRHARSGYVEPRRGPRNVYLFSFQDLIILRVATELVRSELPARRVRRSLERLRSQLPAGRSLSAVRLSAEGEDVVVQDGSVAWEPDSGQYVFGFEVADIAGKALPIARKAAEDETMPPAELFDLALELEVLAIEEAVEVYERLLRIDPRHVDALVNLGRLLHEQGRLASAESRYRAALEADPSSSLAAFNLGVVLEDSGRYRDAIEAYERSISIDDSLADAHYNLAQLYERRGDKVAAFRHLKRFRSLS